MEPGNSGRILTSIIYSIVLLEGGIHFEKSGRASLKPGNSGRILTSIIYSSARRRDSF